jgi:cysteinyl-tRNA synthetase
MDDDLNGPRAAAAIFGYVNALYAAGIEKSADAASLLAVYRALTRHLYIFGIDEVDERLYPELIAETVRGSGAGAESKGGDSVVDRLLELRQSSRKAKDFAKADQIRLLLTEVGVEVEDSPKGTRWTVK